MKPEPKYEYRRRGGKRTDRVFKVYLTLPPSIPEDEMMDYIEEAVCEYRKHEPARRAHAFNADTVAVKRKHPKYADCE